MLVAVHLPEDVKPRNLKIWSVRLCSLVCNHFDQPRGHIPISIRQVGGNVEVQFYTFSAKRCRTWQQANPLSESL
ncbi:hypothetical protein GCM10010873_16720 [Cypionkella aquatica]|uniref:Uncharacterized protein n=1 Tax=Cypionkella aquatica TaxID=1756042 RepID=A0AA37TSK9_9RHOB|nr:hypothetical protein GCM10010873_16720 [Cypionkella aquatica]